jgi:hypothetical protein
MDRLSVGRACDIEYLTAAHDATNIAPPQYRPGGKGANLA